MGTSDVSSSSATTSGQGPTRPEPQAEHRWVERLVGEWTFETEAESEPGKKETGTGSTRVRSIGGLWIVAESEGEIPGMDDRGIWIMTLGYDPRKQQVVGTWVGSMMPNQWVYEGVLDRAADRLTLDTEGPSMKGDGSLAGYREVIEIENDGHWVHTSYAQADGGQWRPFMVTHYRRRN
jgi:Protein of unknown function (DUF1579)